MEMTMEEIMAHCDRQISREPKGSVFYREHEAVKAFLEELAAYKETGLEPEDLKKAFNESAILKLAAQALNTTPEHLRDLIRAEQEGRMVILPAKTVWELTWDAGPDCNLVCPVSVDGNGCCDFCEKGKLFVYERACTQALMKELGKTVFLTREEAEEALAQEGGEG